MIKNLEQTYQNYIFDMDGTIIDSSKEILRCLKRACDKNNAQINKEKFLVNIIGPPIRDIIQEVIIDNRNEDLILKIIKDFRNIYDNDENDTSSMYENTREWLMSLNNTGKRLFLATNKPMKPTLRLIKMLNIDIFENIYTIDKYIDKQINKTEMILEIINNHNLNRIETIMIGDTPSDIKAAHASGIKGVGVLWGYEACKTPLKEISDMILELSELNILQKFSDVYPS